MQQSEKVKMPKHFVLRCTYCQPTIGFEDLASLKEHMTQEHHTSYLTCEQSEEMKIKTLNFHRDFYDSTGIYKDELSYKLCKCACVPMQSTRSKLYLHSIEAGHYPLIKCAKCGILMEREDCAEHAAANCDPVIEGSFFLKAMGKMNKQRSDQSKPEVDDLPAAPKVEEPNF